MNFVKRNWGKIILVTYTFIFPVVSFAETIGTEAPGGKIVDPLGKKFADVPALIKALLEGALRIGMPIVALAIIYSGFLFVFARGNSEKITKAKDALLYTVIGAAILLGSWAIAKMIQATVTGLGS